VSEARAVRRNRKGELPHIVTAEIGDAICEEVAGGKSLRECCRKRDIPIANFFKALHSLPSLDEQYARAREARGELLADEIVAIADEADAENAYAVKVRVDARKWCAARMCRKVYGDSSEVKLSGGVAVTMDMAERLEQLRQASSAPVLSPVGLVTQRELKEAE